MTYLRDFILFLRNPSFEKQFEINSFSSLFKLVWTSFLFLLVFGIITGLGISAPLKYFNLLPTSREIDWSSINIIKISLLLPIIEELIFRLPLRISKLNISTSLSLILFLIINKLNIYIGLISSITLFSILNLIVENESNIIKRTKIFVDKKFIIIYYLQALIFGFLHLTNYRLDLHLFYLFPLFVINQIFAGCLLGYIRVRYNNGITLCIIIHIVLNLIYCITLSK